LVFWFYVWKRHHRLQLWYSDSMFENVTIGCNLLLHINNTKPNLKIIPNVDRWISKSLAQSTSTYPIRLIVVSCLNKIPCLVIPLIYHKKKLLLSNVLLEVLTWTLQLCWQHMQCQALCVSRKWGCQQVVDIVWNWLLQTTCRSEIKLLHSLAYLHDDNLTCWTDMNSNPMYNDVTPSWDISNDYVCAFSKNIINFWSSHVRRRSSTYKMKMTCWPCRMEK
jgi:hypothetical protein